jgi:type IV pilus assembly protein PilA
VHVTRKNGFSLIELLIVVAIILIIAAIAIPNLLRARISANEASAVGSVRTVNTSEVAYASAYPTVGYANGLTVLTGTCTGTVVPTSGSACLIDSVLASGSKSGYSFALAASGGPPTGTYEVDAAPKSPNQTGVRYFCSVADAVVRYGTSAAFSNNCASTGTPLQ